jgi:hypothetical protein
MPAQSTRPVLLTGFNRPDVTARTFDALRAYRPAELFVALDGPRPEHPRDPESCAAVREIVGRVDWDCHAEYLIRDENLGCRRAMTGAIDWFFDAVEEGVIVEDDCLPSASFFSFCDTLLDRYRDDERVWMVSGTNGLGSWRPGDASYFFCTYGSVWGWATWRRAWSQADIELSGLASSERVAAARRSWGESRWAVMEPQLQGVASGEIDTWDYGWAFSYASRGGLAATPAENLVANIGFGAGATHTTPARHRLSALRLGRLDKPLRHPTAVAADAEYDRRFLAVDRLPRHLRARALIGRALPGAIRTPLRRILRVGGTSDAAGR